MENQHKIYVSDVKWISTHPNEQLTQPPTQSLPKGGEWYLDISFWHTAKPMVQEPAFHSHKLD